VVLVELCTWLVARVRYAGTAARLFFHAWLVLTAMVVAIVGGALLLLGLGRDEDIKRFAQQK
jgi:hypothetical protein